MSTIDLRPSVPFMTIEGKSIIAQATVDFSKTPAVKEDVIKVLRLPKGAIVEQVSLIVHKTESTTKVSAGIESDTDAFLVLKALTDIKANDNAGTAEGAYMTATPKFIPANDSLCLEVDAAAAASVVSVVCKYHVVAKTFMS
jgi:hypothetical protein